MWHLAFRPYRFPFRVPIRTAHGRWEAREGFLLKARARRPDGSADPTIPVRYAELAPLPAFGSESIADAARALAALGEYARDLADALTRCPAGHPALLAALHALLDPTPPPAAEARALPVAALLPAGRAALAVVADRVAFGFRTFKWKVGVADPADELALLDDVLAELPEGARLRLDANGAWDRRCAERWFARAVERPIEYIEQPIPPGASGAEDIFLGLAADYPTPLALDESLGGPDDLARWLALGWKGVWVIKPALLGAPGPALDQLAAAQADLVFGSALETGLGARAGLRLAFAWAERRKKADPAHRPRALGYGVYPLFEDTRADGPLAVPFIRPSEVAPDPAREEALWTALA
jgi:o-succinylbenzoate synthase